MADAPPARKLMPAVRLDQTEFTRNFTSQFIDPAFAELQPELEAITKAAWDAYSHSRKAPRTQKAGPGYADPDYDLSVDWIAAKAAVDSAQTQHDAAGPRHVLLINGSSRSEHTCPGESSKSWRFIEMSREVIEGAGLTTATLDLSRLASEYGRNIHPCKGCFSTAAALCHWPCSCYPNYSLGQTQDWMNEIYPMWVRAHGILIVSPVNWHAPSSPIKLMMDRMVCADGGNPDPTSTHGKTVAEAKALELDRWEYPRHLQGPAVFGDRPWRRARRGECPAFAQRLAALHADGFGRARCRTRRYVGYWEPYATSHEALDKDVAVQGEVRQAATTLGEALKAQQEGRWTSAGSWLTPPRQK